MEWPRGQEVDRSFLERGMGQRKHHGRGRGLRPYRPESGYVGGYQRSFDRGHVSSQQYWRRNEQADGRSARARPLLTGRQVTNAEYTRSITFKQLQDLERDERPEQLAHSLASSRLNLGELYREGGDKRTTEMLLNVLGKVVEAKETGISLTPILQLVLKEGFLGRLNSYLDNMKDSKEPAKLLTPVYDALKLLKAFLTVLPNSSRMEVAVTMVFIDSMMQNLADLATTDILEYQTEVGAILTNLNEEYQRNAMLRPSRRDRLDKLHGQPPPDEFRDIPVFPRLSDINGDALPFMRTNLVNSAYESLAHYLDVQFRLLREDFIRPLREGIATFKRSRDDWRVRYENVKVYENVTILFMTPGQENGILHRIKFNATKLRRLNWQDTKRLLHGSLLCLSSDQFNEEAIFAVVMDRNANDLEKGMLTVQFVLPERNEEDENQIEAGAENMPQSDRRTQVASMSDILDRTKVYTMVETNAYFEAYRHVLSGLKETTDLPLERYIVHLSPDVQTPLYLRPSVAGRNAEYDFSVILKKSKMVPARVSLDLGLRAQLDGYSNEEGIWDMCVPPGGTSSAPDCTEDDEFFSSSAMTSTWHPSSMRCFNSVSLHDSDFVEILSGAWPSPEEMSLDPSQAEAVKVALTKELAVIQGPPGTGKTHVGLTVMKLLLRNNRPWSGMRGYDSSTLLVLCYTNHALDQFVEGITEFVGSRGLVRVGNRSKNEAIKPFSLQNRRRERFFDTTKRQLERELERIEETWNSNIEKLKASLDCISNLRELEPFIPANLFRQFGLDKSSSTDGWSEDRLQAQKRMDNDVLLSWLGIEHKNTENAAEEPGKQETLIDESTENVDEDMEFLYKTLLDTDEIPYNPHETRRRWSMKSITEEIGALSLAKIEANNHSRGKVAEKDDKMWEQQRHQRRKQKRRIQIVIRGTEIMTEFEENHVSDIYNLFQDDRWRLYRTWLSRWRLHCRSGIDEQVEEYNTLAVKLSEARRQIDAEILQEADVVAATTTGAAKHREVISKLDCKIVIVEEAAEILEAHIVAALPKSTNHLILIGDHKQLRPSPTVYELGRRYNLDTSLFERLMKKIPHVTLSKQHRMSPAIANLIRPHIYKNLEDHDSVLNRGEITGISKTVFFVSHEEKEDVIIDGSSRKNTHEADFIIALSHYIIQQGYKPEQVTILTAYTGQLLAFRDSNFEKVPDGVRVTAVDNFQGEENDIILLSLVRSNDEAKIGFLGVDNRICVALSRAKHALYCIGNMEMLASENKTWGIIVQHLRETGCIGKALTLQCKHHPDRRTQVSCAKDFDKVPEGGCGYPCETRLDCGHVCPKSCHPKDHFGYNCLKPCDRTVPCEKKHLCKKKCWEPCEPCLEILQKVMPTCGHVQPLICHISPEDVDCMEKVEVELLCGHRVSIPCYQAQSPELSMCKENCHEVLECGHQCQGSCYKCFQGRLHVPCEQTCGRRLVCGHTCNAFCNSCLPCRSTCKTRCKHRRCNKLCGQPCDFCSEKCEWACEHFKCSRLCSEPCDRPPCNEPCRRKLKCGHFCIGLCGEPCLRLCRICHRSKVEEILAGEGNFEDARFVRLEDCGHLFPYQYLDRWMNQKDENTIKMKECPKCRTLVWRSTRYGTVINAILDSLNKVKMKVWGDSSRLKNKIQLKFDAIPVKNYSEDYRVIHVIRRIYKSSKKENLSKGEAYIIYVMFRRLVTLKNLIPIQNPGLQNTDSVTRTKTLNGIYRNMERIQEWILSRRTQPTIHDERCLRREMVRILQAYQLCSTDHTLMSRSKNERELWKPIAERLHRLLLENFKPYDEETDNEVKSLYKEVAMEPRIFSLQLTKEDKKVIARRTRVCSEMGDWHMCPLGHVYVAKRCKAPTEKPVCRECKEAIDSGSQRLMESTHVATEIVSEHEN